MSKLLIFEGIDGSGKTTQLKKLRDYLELKNQKVFVTREPGGSEFGEECRGLFLNNKLDGLTEAFLAFAARNDHITQKIKPALQLGHWVLCDRFSDSTIAYQGYGRGVDITFLKKICSKIEEHLNEFRVIYIETKLETCLQRIEKRGAIEQRFDNSSKLFFERIIEGYSKITKERGDKLIRINGNRAVDTVFNDIIRSVPELRRLKLTSERKG